MIDRNKFRLTLLSVFIILCCAFSSQAQTLTDAYIITSPDSSGITHGTIYVQIGDTSNVAEIQVQIGSTSGAQDLVNYSFAFDVTNGLPAGYYYSRNGYHILLNTGTFQDVLTLFGKVRIKNSSGVWEDYLSFITN